MTCILSKLICFGQSEQKAYRFAFDQINHTYQTLNPTVLKNKEHTFNSILGFNDFNSLSKNVYAMYVKADLTIRQENKRIPSRIKNRQKKTPFHNITLNLFPEKEGIYINKTRGYFGYSYALPLNEKVMLSLGLQLGFINYAITIPGGSSGIIPDATAGIGIFTDNFCFGFSSNQLMNNTLSLFIDPIQFARFYTAMTEKKIELNPLWDLKSSLFSTFNTPFSDLTFTNLFYYNDSFYTGASWRLKYGLMMMVGVENVRLSDLLFLFATSYRVNIGNGEVINTNRIELTLGISF